MQPGSAVPAGCECWGSGGKRPSTIRHYNVRKHSGWLNDQRCHISGDAAQTVVQPVLPSDVGGVLNKIKCNLAAHAGSTCVLVLVCTQHGTPWPAKLQPPADAPRHVECAGVLAIPNHTMQASGGCLNRRLGNSRPHHRDSADVLEMRNEKAQVVRAANVITGKEEGGKVRGISAEGAGVLAEGVHRNAAMEASQLSALFTTSNIRLRWQQDQSQGAKQPYCMCR